MPSPEVIHFVVREDGTVDTHVNAAGDLSRINPAEIGQKVWNALTQVKVKLTAPLDLASLIALDQQENPYGHPCRDCGQLARDHPVQGVLECRDWR